MTDGQYGPRIFLDVLVANDDDGDLTSDPITPDYQAIYDSFWLGHSWPPATGALLTVEWDGPPGNPVDGVDYVVDYSLTPPRITLKTVEADVPPLTYPVRRWFIGRAEVAPEELFDIGEINTEWEASRPFHDVTVVLQRRISLRRYQSSCR